MIIIMNIKIIIINYDHGDVNYDNRLDFDDDDYDDN